MKKYDVARGTRDLLPIDMAVRNHVEKVIRKTFESYGFQQITTPMFESFGLLAARSGEEIRESMFTFVSDNEEFALRPELTAPVCRVIASGKLGSLALPYKLYYIGQCFRYCRPQAGRYREFTQAGLELMGSSDPMADAEVVAVAARTLQSLGINQFQLKIGNIGIFRRLLEKIYPDDFETQSRVISHIDNIMSVREKCGAIRSHRSLDPEDIDYIRVETETLYRIQEECEYSGEFELLPETEYSEKRALERLDILPKVAEATYSAMWRSNEIVPDETADLLIRVSRVRGSLDSVMPQAKELLSDTPSARCLDELAMVCTLLKAYGLSHFEVVLGVARGLDFYTGTVFEIDSPLLGAQKQICGGGRYDKLVGEFGGSSIPATGFAFGFDRVVETFQKSGLSTTLVPVDVFVIVADASYRKLALETAERLRKSEFRVAVDLMGLDLREQLGYAANLGAEFAVIIGTKELNASDCNLRCLSTRTEKTVPLSSVANEIKCEVGGKV